MPVYEFEGLVPVVDPTAVPLAEYRRRNSAGPS
jgi:hypothetical protein